MLSKLADIQRMLGATKILTCFSGRFSQGLIEEMGEAVKKHMESEEQPRNDIFNVFSIFIEQTQNIKNYMSSKVDHESLPMLSNSSIVCIGKDDYEYFIWSGNIIENTDIAPLEAKLSIVQKSSKDELKKLYKEVIKQQFDPSKSGAGIGLIDIGRKASKPIEYSFEKIDDKFSYYEIKVLV